MIRYVHATSLGEELRVPTVLSKFAGFQMANISVNDVLNVGDELQKKRMLRVFAR